MVRRKIQSPCVVPVNMRITEVMKRDADAAADSLRISTNEYIRIAIQEKLERDSSCGSAAPLPAGIDRDVLRAVIREELEKMEKEEAAHGAL